LNAKKPKNPRLIINIPVELAREIFRESGDLGVGEFPALLILADSIGEAMSAGHYETAIPQKPTILRKSRKTTVSHRGPRKHILLTR
jgi:hypothetical protein